MNGTPPNAMSLSPGTPSVNAFALKLIAAGCMLADHAAYVFPDTFPPWFRWIGRIAFPIFAYMIAQGCVHTRDIRKYLLRLGALAVISEFPFRWAFGIPWNVFFTLFLGAAAVALYRRSKANVPGMAAIAVLPAMILAEWFQTDYGGFGVLLIFLLYLANPDRKVARGLILTAGMAYLYGFKIGNWPMLLCSLIAVLLVTLYTGRQGPKVKWAFYVFYPAHILLLAVIRWIGM